MRCVGSIYPACACARGSGHPVTMCALIDLRTMRSNKLVFADDLQCQVELLVLLRRISGGINASEQQALYRKYASRAVARRKAV